MCSYRPGTAQLGRLLKLAFSDIEEAAARQTAFSLLKVSERAREREGEKSREGEYNPHEGPVHGRKVSGTVKYAKAK